MPATVLHAFTNPQLDGTGTDYVRPSDWNSAHLMSLAPSGAEMIGGFSNENGVSFTTNTAGRIVASVVLASSLSFGNANGVTFGVDASTVTASVVTAYMGTSERNNYVPLANSTQFAGVSHSHGAVAGTNISATSASNGLSLSVAPQTAVQFSNSNGISFGTNGSTVTASHNGLTTAAQSNHSHGVSLNLTNLNGTTGGNSAGISLSLSVPAQTVQTQGMVSFNGNTGPLSLAVGSSLSSSVNGVSSTFGMASNITTALQSAGAYLTTAAQSNHSHGNPTLALTNLSGTTASASNGLTISLSAAAGGGGADGYNIIGVNGGATQASTTYQLSNANNITFGLNAGTITASASYPSQTVQPAVAQLNGSSGTMSLAVGSSLSSATAGSTITFGLASNITTALQSAGNYLTTAMQSGASVNFAATGFTTTTGAGAVVAGTHDTAGLKLAIPAFLTTAQAPGAYLTTARASNDAIGLNTALTANGVSMSANSSGLSLNFPAFLTTAAQSGHSHGNPTLALTNLTGTTASGSNGLTLSLSAGAAGAINQTGPNIAVAGSTITSGDVVFSNANGVTFGMNGSTITASAAGGGGVTNTMWFPFNEAVNVVGQQGQGTLHLVPVPTPDIGAATVTFDRLCFPILHSHATNSTGSVTLSMWFGLYTRENSTGTRISLEHSTSFSTGYTFSGTANSSALSGLRLITIPWTSSVKGNRYIVGIASRTTTGGANCTISQLLISNINSNFSGVLGQATNSSYQWPIGWGQYSATTSGLPGSIAYSQIYGTNSNAMRNPEWYLVNGTA